MAKKNAETNVNDLLRTLIVVELGLAGVPQKEIREIVGGDIVFVNQIVKRLKRRSTRSASRKPFSQLTAGPENLGRS